MISKESILEFITAAEHVTGSLKTEDLRTFLKHDDSPETRMQLIEVVKTLETDAEAYSKIKKDADQSLKVLSNKVLTILEAYKEDFKDVDELDAVEYTIYNKGSEKCEIIDATKIPRAFGTVVPETWVPDLNVIKTAISLLDPKETEYAKIVSTINVNWKNAKKKKGGKK